MPEIPPLTDLITVLTGGASVIGGIIGFAQPAPTTRDMLTNTALGVTLGAFAGTLLAFVVGLVDVIAGG